METIAIIGSAPNGTTGPVRAASFKQFQELLGFLEQARPGGWPGAHAACHAFMNGVERVVFAGVKSAADSQQHPQPWEEALASVMASEEPSLVVAPGASEAVQEALATLMDKAWQQGARSVLLMDPSSRLRPEEVLPWWKVKNYASNPAVRGCWPPVSTLTPGRRNYETLPASCLVGPLLLGTAAELKGLHETPGLPPDVQQNLVQAEFAVLEPRGVRGHPGLLAQVPLPDNERPKLQDAPDATPGRLQTRLQEAIADLLDKPNSPGLWKTIERRATAVLVEMQERGEISGFHVRCDAETNEGSSSPVVEVLLRQPQRVRELVVRVVGDT